MSRTTHRPTAPRSTPPRSTPPRSGPPLLPPDRHRVDGRTLELRRAWPRGEGDPIALELVDADDRTVVGRWFPVAQHAAAELARTPGARRGDDPRLLLQPHGADRALPALAAAIDDGAHLVAHRPGRRAVVRLPGGDYLKVVRDGRAPRLARRHEQLASALAGVAAVPEVRDHDGSRVRLAPLPGDDAWRGDVAGSCAQLGRVLARLAVSPPDRDLPVHDAAAEAEVTRTWLARAVRAGRLPAADPTPVLAPLLRDPPQRHGLAHRDLHDGQLRRDGRRLGVLDPDTLAVAEPALDLANVLAHLDLRVAQGLLAPADRLRGAAALWRAAVRDPATAARVPAHLAAARLRLAAVHSFRPRWHALARRWHAELLAGEPSEVAG